VPYDESKDKCLKEWMLPSDLCIGVYQYNGGEKKIQVGPRVMKKNGGGEIYAKAGRMSAAELKGLTVLAPEILAVMEG
jgi:hypothetical protein